MADSNDKRVFEEEGQQKDYQDKDEETNSTTLSSKIGLSEPTKNRPSRAAGPRRFTDDDDSSVGSSSSEASASSDTSEHSQSSSSCPSPIRLPTGCLRGIHDKPGGCDEAELRAREKRCMEIMRSSAERARAKAANIKPLTWAEPTFECGPTVADVNAASNLLGKRKEHPDQDSSSSFTTRRNNPSPSHLDLMQGQVFYNPRRQPSEEEVERFVKFVKENMP